VWVNILKRVKNSVLWIKTNNKSFENNLKKEAIEKKLNPNRIIIAEGIKDISDHIERLKLADIFLDTYPYNSHSTSYDYIRAELPMVVWEGKTYASRVASSIYSSIDMDNLIAKNKLEYENIATELGNNKLKLKEIKNKLKKIRENHKLFDSSKITKELEKIYKNLIDKTYWIRVKIWMIIWLASYPKSGNTWIRLFLDNLFSSSDKFHINQNLIQQFPLRKHFYGLTKNINNQNELAKNCIDAQLRLNLDGKIKILKTHNALWKFNNGEYSFTDEINTIGVIHIVRDPRNIVTSILNYFKKKNYKDAIEFMEKDKVIGGGSEDADLPTIIGSWSNHYKSWKKFKKNYLLVKYEDLLKDPKNEFFKITNYLKKVANYNFDQKKIEKAIVDCDFQNLSDQEDTFGFDGNSPTNKKLNQKFFNLGPRNKWQDILDDKIKDRIELIFKDEMKDLRYL